MCTAAGLPLERADASLEIVGLSDAGKRKVRGFSLGMRQRLALAAAMLGDPKVLVLDEPANGLDPDGIRWLRGFFRHMAGEGRTVLVSSHQLNEVQEIADRVVILNRGQLVRAGSIQELLAGSASVVARGPNLGPLDAALRAQGLSPTQTGPMSLLVQGADTDRIGHLAFVNGVELHELSKQGFDLEDLFFQLTAAQYSGAQMGAAQTGLPQEGPAR
jgi:ABC-2 type transport system ATP-binding protein